MARGPSGRIVIEVDPQLKNDLYVELARREMTLKSWFLKEARSLLPKGKPGSGGRRSRRAKRK